MTYLIIYFFIGISGAIIGFTFSSKIKSNWWAQIAAFISVALVWPVILYYAIKNRHEI